MIRAFHAIKRHEEGQALVLAAITMLVLALCVMSTVNISYAAKERIELQNATDAAAYTTAAYEARAMNFYAYTNRAMTVQYASQMNLLAVLSYFTFTVIIIQIIANICEEIPFVGEFLAVVADIYDIVLMIFYYADVVAIPFIDGLNYGMTLMQTAVGMAMGTQMVSLPQETVQKANPAYQVNPLSNYLPNPSLTPTALGVSNVVNTNPTPSLGSLISAIDPNMALNRLMMTEIANSARNQWTVYGQPPPSFTIGLLPRKVGPLSVDLINLGILDIQVYIGKLARTEWGSMLGVGAGSGIEGLINSILGGPDNPTEQIFSIDRFEIKVSLKVLMVTIVMDFKYDVQAHADRDLVDSWGASYDSSKATIYVPESFGISTQGMPGGLLGDIIKPIVAAATSWITIPVNAVLQPIFSEACEDVLEEWVEDSEPPIFHFGQVPYATFIPVAHVGPQGAQNGLFNQPPVVLMVTAPDTYLAGKGQPFMGYFGVKLGSLSSGSATSDAAYNATRNTAASKRGFVSGVDYQLGDTSFMGASSGFHAMAASMAYYHRPGDWREPPNLFNPMWGAKLMPIADYPTIRDSGTLGNLFSQQLLVH